MRSRGCLRVLLVSLPLSLAGCTDQEQPASDVGHDNAAITFGCCVAADGSTRAVGGYTGSITAGDDELHYAGFGVFATTVEGTAPTLMYNQRVDYVFMADGATPVSGYWTYSPLKYWPADVAPMAFYAYAPYVATPASGDGDTGIVGLSANDVAVPYVDYARALHPEDNVDLLWCYRKPLSRSVVPLEMHHALARVAVALRITNIETLAASTKVLVSRLTLTTAGDGLATTGRLLLNGDADGTGRYVPAWTAQHTEAATIIVDCDPESVPQSYGIIAEEARYISALPVRWQPDGLPHSNSTATNLISMGDAPSYLYLIPQPELAVHCTVDFCTITAAGTVTNYSKATTAPVTLSPLNGNTTYGVTLSVTL